MVCTLCNRASHRLPLYKRICGVDSCKLHQNGWCRKLTSNSTTTFDKLYRGVSLIRFSDTGVATPYFVRGHANGNTTQIRRYDDGLVLYLRV